MIRRAIITTVHPYDQGVVVGSHHIAQVLARRGWQVLLLTDPASLAHATAAPFNQRAARRMAETRKGLVEVAPNLKTLTPFTMLPLSGRVGAGSTFILDNWCRMCLPPLGRQLAAAGFDTPDLMMFDGALCRPLRDMLRPRKTVLRLFDFPDGANVLPEALSAQERALAAECDVVAISARELEPVARQWNARDIVLVENGVDPGHFSPPVAAPADYAAIPGPRVLYMGAIARWIDHVMMADVARAMPDVSFVWIGPGRLAVGADLPNVHVLGPRSYRDLPAYLQHASVGVIPFNRASHPDLVNAVNPLKLYEYAAAGLPIVATPTAEICRIGGPVRLADDAPAFVAALREAIRTPDARPVLQNFAAGASWEQRTAPLLARLGLDGGRSA